MEQSDKVLSALSLSIANGLAYGTDHATIGNRWFRSQLERLHAQRMRPKLHLPVLASGHKSPIIRHCPGSDGQGPKDRDFLSVF
jgi:hypothetical protein